MSLDANHKSMVQKALTPAQFDNSENVATTEFVQRALGNCAGVVSLQSGTVNLLANDAGKHFIFSVAGASATAYIPDSSTVPVGATMSFQVSSDGSLGIARTGADVFTINGTPITGFMLTKGDDLTLVKTSTGVWFARGGAALGASPRFGASLAASGYQKLPSGLIIQWGPISAIAAGGTIVVTFPIAFPSALFAVSGIAGNFGGVNATLFDQNLVGAKFFNTQAGTVTSATGTYIAIGK